MTLESGRESRFGRAVGGPLPQRVLVLASFAAVLGCVPSRGGWDVEALLATHPELAASADQRLGDMVPFPALDLDAGPSDAAEVSLVACRFAAGATMRVHADGSGWDEAVGTRGLAAFAALVEGFELALAVVAQGPAEIAIDAAPGAVAEGPNGLGDTLVECDVGKERAEDSSHAAGGVVRGEVVRAEIRMRRSGEDLAGRLRRASDEEWLGALLHELSHAVGFAGHAATGESLVVRDEHHLRRLGRRVLAGQPLEDPTLTALHRLRPGERLGERRLEARSARWLERLRALDRRVVADGNRRVALLASVGDREARWWIRYADGRRLGLRFPGWPERLREGRTILAWPEAATLEAMRAAAGRSALSP